MSSATFMTMIETVLTYDLSRSKRHKHILDAAMEVTRSPFFKEHDDLFTLTPCETAELPATVYPNGLYSIKIDPVSGKRRFVVILRTSVNGHLYFKLMLDADDHSAIRHRFAYVSSYRSPTIHHDLEGYTIDQVKDYIKKQGITLDGVYP